jgi:Domain of unknown function (DUF1918)
MPATGARGTATAAYAKDEEVGAMQAAVGDRLHVHGKVVGQAEHAGEIVEVHGTGGAPPYLVRFDDGHTRLVFPGPDAIVEDLQHTGSSKKSSR